MLGAGNPTTNCIKGLAGGWFQRSKATPKPSHHCSDGTNPHRCWDHQSQLVHAIDMGHRWFFDDMAMGQY